VFYKDVSDGMVMLIASAEGLDAGEHALTVFPFVPVERGEVAIYTGETGWINKDAADAQAQIAVNLLDDEGIVNTWYQDPLEAEDLAAWVDESTENGRFDVLILYGFLPPALYPEGNAMPDDSIADLRIDVLHGRQNALAEVALGIGIAQLDRLA